MMGECAAMAPQINPAEVAVLVPQHPRLGAERGFQRDRHVALAVDAREDDDASLHWFHNRM
jgi:hypothetical protein